MTPYHSKYDVSSYSKHVMTRVDQSVFCETIDEVKYDQLDPEINRKYKY